MKQILLITLGLSTALFASFSKNGNIVTDNSTGLQWQDDANVTKTWTEAIDYCESLTLGTHNDWRLPNFNELYYVADRSKYNPAINSAFKNVVSDFYWSSSTVVGYEDLAWVVDFYVGGSYWLTKSNSNYVRCVRAGQ